MTTMKNFVCPTVVGISLLVVGLTQSYTTYATEPASTSQGAVVGQAIGSLLVKKDDAYIQKFYDFLDTLITKFTVDNDTKRLTLLSDLKEILVSVVPIPNINIAMNTNSNNTTIVNNVYNTYTNTDNSNTSINTNTTITDNSVNQNQNNSVNYTDNSVNFVDNTVNVNNPSNPTTPNTPTIPDKPTEPEPETPTPPVVREPTSATSSATSTIRNSVIAQEAQNVTLAQWTVTIKNGSLQLKEVKLDGTFDTTVLNNGYITYTSNNGTNGEYQITTVTTSQLATSNINANLPAGMYTFSARANFGSLPSGSAGVINLNAAHVIFDETYPDTPRYTTTPISYQHRVVKNYPVIITLDPNTGNDPTKIFTIRAVAINGTDPVVIRGFTFDLQGGTLKADGVKLTDSNGAVAGTNVAGKFEFAEGITIRPGQDHSFTVRSAIPMSRDNSYSAQLKDVKFAVDGTLYENNGMYNNIANWSNAHYSRRI